MKPASGWSHDTVLWGDAPGSTSTAMAANATGIAIETRGHTRVSFQLYSAGGAATHVGTISVQVSDDGSNWDSVTLSSTPTLASGTAFTASIDLDTASRLIRPVYAYTSGTGTLSGVYTLKG